MKTKRRKCGVCGREDNPVKLTRNACCPDWSKLSLTPKRKGYSFGGVEGCVIVRKVHSTGTHVGIYFKTFESDPEWPWTTVCEEHGGCINHHSLELARQWAPHPEDWCPTCKGEEPVPENPKPLVAPPAVCGDPPA